MILKGSQRSGAVRLAAHLLNDQDSDHVQVTELRGFVARDLEGAFREAHAISKDTRCSQFLFSLSLNPPLEAEVSEEAFRKAADDAGQRLGLQDQPRALIFHEKEGRRHAHVVWSRINADSLKAINLPFYKTRLRDLAKELYLEHGWDLPQGLQTHGGKNPFNFTLAEWQQAKRQGVDPREICPPSAPLGHLI
ncbi:relaxase/mobilization nuclease domain-containing protein [Aestuariibius sp. 2305UL40-4]|uniref:relaxase/mobilization nuclease domain-containing protein n=1 Tax=Aestuariibius violaceus TaxID=3234132 RepID=UPI00345E6CB2